MWKRNGFSDKQKYWSIASETLKHNNWKSNMLRLVFLLLFCFAMNFFFCDKFLILPFHMLNYWTNGVLLHTLSVLKCFTEHLIQPPQEHKTPVNMPNKHTHTLFSITPTKFVTFQTRKCQPNGKQISIFPSRISRDCCLSEQNVFFIITVGVGSVFVVVVIIVLFSTQQIGFL